VLFIAFDFVIVDVAHLVARFVKDIRKLIDFNLGSLSREYP
jgi:hypothetical protein